jgi:predicted  nucleic acid-binding Zn-ribbon protein
MDQEIKPSEQTVESLNNSLVRLRKRLTYVQDEMQITSFAIKAIEHDLAEIEKEDSHAQKE